MIGYTGCANKKWTRCMLLSWCY